MSQRDTTIISPFTGLPRKDLAPNPYSTDLGTLPSSAVEWRDGAFYVLHSIQEFGGRVYKALASFPTKDSVLPCATVTLFREEMDSEGQWNQGAPHFLHTATLHVAILAFGDDPMVLDGTIMDLMEKVKNYLLRSNYWISLAEGVSKITTEIRYPRDGDLVLCEVRMGIDGIFTSFWQPTIDADFKEMYVQRRLTETQDAGLLDDDFDPGTGDPINMMYLFNPIGLTTGSPIVGTPNFTEI